ncbi:Histone-lysine N-methyltransferase, H3 lysine-79 specific, partial [Ophiophagus hannah]
WRDLAKKSEEKADKGWVSQSGGFWGEERGAALQILQKSGEGKGERERGRERKERKGTNERTKERKVAKERKKDGRKKERRRKEGRERKEGRKGRKERKKERRRRKEGRERKEGRKEKERKKEKKKERRRRKEERERKEGRKERKERKKEEEKGRKKERKERKKEEEKGRKREKGRKERKKEEEKGRKRERKERKNERKKERKKERLQPIKQLFETTMHINFKELIEERETLESSLPLCWLRPKTLPFLQGSDWEEFHSLPLAIRDMKPPRGISLPLCLIASCETRTATLQAASSQQHPQLAFMAEMGLELWVSWWHAEPFVPEYEPQANLHVHASQLIFSCPYRSNRPILSLPVIPEVTKRAYSACRGFFQASRRPKKASTSQNSAVRCSAGKEERGDCACMLREHGGVHCILGAGTQAHELQHAHNFGQKVSHHCTRPTGCHTLLVGFDLPNFRQPAVSRSGLQYCIVTAAPPQLTGN